MKGYKKTLSQKQVAKFNQNGYLIINSHFDQEQVKRLFNFATQNEAIGKNAYGMLDKDGKASKLALWFTPGKDPFGLLARSESLVGTVDQLSDGSSDVAHYYSKLMQKEPHGQI